MTRRAAGIVSIALITLLTALAALGIGCARDPGPPPIALGSSCAACGMSIGDLRFACERQVGESWHVYDSIECLVREEGGPAFLADYDTRTLHTADSMWVVHGSFPSPMGGGLAAFMARASADDVAARTDGRVDRLAAFSRAPASGTP